MPKSKSGKERGALEAVDLSLKLDLEAYERRLGELQEQLRLIQQAYLASGDSAVLVFEGWDAAGKGGAIRRISSALDPRGLKVWPISAPRAYYKERHYLARFWDKLPPRGAVAIFDRSWYGRVLVERVEGFADRSEWKRAYREIEDFERLLLDDGTRVLKFFLHISPEEQLERFEKRLRDPAKRWKLSYEDFRNRAQWDDYVEAIEDMIDKTSTKDAPWTVVPAENKKYARIAVIEEVVARLAKGVDLDPPAPDPALLEAAAEHFDPPEELWPAGSRRTE